MSDPLALLPYALAARGGQVDGHAARDLVTAGLTLLRRAPSLPRTLAGRRAGLLLPPGPAAITALGASDGRGAVLLHPFSAPAELRTQIDEADVGVVFTIAALAGDLPVGLPRVLLDDAPRSVRVIDGVGARDVSLVGEAPLPLAGDPDVDGSHEEALIAFTSAMAGRPLAAVLTHRNLLANARGTIIAAELSADDHLLAPLPMPSLLGMTAGLLAPLLAGARVTTVPRANPVQLLDRLAAGGCTALLGTPPLFAAMLEAAARRGSGLSAPQLRLCLSVGTAIDVALQDAWFDATGVELRHGYAVTEAGPMCCFNRVGLVNHRGTLGVPHPGVEVEIHHLEHGAPCPPKVEGEIWVRGESISPGYLRRTDAGLERRGDWLRTGDRGVRNVDGTFTFRGRIRPVVTHGAFDLYPREIELALSEMPGVTRARVFAMPLAAGDTALGAEVWGDVTPDEVRRWCTERLARYKHPRDIVVRAPVA